MTSPTLLTGGTGTLGRHVLPLLRSAGCDVRVLSRHRHVEDGIDYVVGDLATGEGIAAAVDGVATIVHCAGSSKGDEVKMRHLVEAATTQHVVNISVVGAERIPVVSRLDRSMFGHFASKRAAERVLEDSGLPWTNLRATQFYDLILTVAEKLTKLPVVPVFAGQRFQPVDAGEVAERMVELALGPPAGLVPDLAGPHIYGMDELIRSYLRANGKHRLLLPIRTPGKASKAIRSGANLAPDQAMGKRVWEDFLAERRQH